MEDPKKSFLLKEYLIAIEGEILQVLHYRNKKITHITNDSRKVQDNSIFIAISGSECDGHKYISKAIQQGASVVIYEKPLDIAKDSDITYVRVNNTYYAYAVICAKYFDNPTEKLKLIGITGTNGKTTSSYLIRAILQKAGKKVGLISTVEYSNGEIFYSADRTTPEAYELQKLFYEMVQNQCEYVVMEVSSHALSQCRTGRAKYKGVLFTNLSGDHLDYHKDMESYFQAKSKLFNECLDHTGISVVNRDDTYGKRLIAKSEKTVSYGFEDQCAYKIISGKDPFLSCTSGIYCNRSFVEFNTSLLGKYNAYNVAGVFALCSELGVDRNIIVSALKENIVIPGRLERVPCGRNILFFVDYAHTDDALERVLSTMRELKPKQLIVVFGCGGNRDKSKRPRMGKVVSTLADVTIVTSDNPRKEQPLDIIKDILVGIVPNTKYYVIENRREAIFEAVKIAEEKSIVLVAGKGHEDYQEINGKKYPFSDKQVLKEAIEEGVL